MESHSVVTATIFFILELLYWNLEAISSPNNFVFLRLPLHDEDTRSSMLSTFLHVQICVRLRIFERNIIITEFQ